MTVFSETVLKLIIKNKDTAALVEKEIDDLENFPLTECQQAMVNFLRANIDKFIDEESIF